MLDERLNELRAEVDVINMQILELLSRRGRVVEEIGKVTQELSRSFYDPQREATMLNALEQANKGPFSNDTIKALFREIFRASMALEESQARAKILVHRKTADERTVIHLPDGTESPGYLITGVMGMWHLGPVRVFANLENFLDARQTRDMPLVLGTPQNPVFPPVWGPTDGFIANAGVIVEF